MSNLNQRIKTKKETTARRAEMLVKCFELKIQNNKLSINQKDKLNQYFKQAKYLVNDIIGTDILPTLKGRGFYG
jgi:ferritin-like metal-binding protein YciE